MTPLARRRAVQMWGRVAITLFLWLRTPASTPPLEARRLIPLTTGAVIINEVAWMGTAASPTDEWIELHNTSPHEIALDGWTLQGNANNTPNITLSGNIPAGGFFLLERTDDTTVSDITADQIYTGDLVNTGESLTLRNAANSVIDTANANEGAWPAGDNISKASMERINPLEPDSDANWATHTGLVRNGLDANGNPLNGTPKARNAAALPPNPENADLQVLKTGPLTASAGATITYTLHIANIGQRPAVSPRITDTLPTGVVFRNSRPAPALAAGQNVIWNLDALGIGAECQITLTGTLVPTAPLTLVNTLVAHTATPESTRLNNTALWTTTLTNVLINAVLFDGLAPLDTDEAVQIQNLSTAPAYLNGWELCKIASGNDACRALPNITLPPQGGIWLTRDLETFQQSFGFAADYLLSPWLMNNLANEGDELILRDAAHSVIDAVVFGENGDPNAAGWQGDALQVYQNDVASAEGQILHRIPDELTGQPVTDTHTLADWMQAVNDPLRGRRAVFPGWDFVEPFFWPLTTTTSATLMLGVTPDNGYAIISRTLESAQESISIEVYTLNHGDLTDLLVAKAQSGVSVTVLLEGSPTGMAETDPRWQAELQACQLLETAGGQCYFMIHETAESIFARYELIHAKFILVDNRWVVITSQNFGNASIPSDDKRNGTFGSRGVVLATDAQAVVDRVTTLFNADCDPAHHRDILRWNTGGYTRYSTPINAVDLHAADATTYTVIAPEPLVLHGAFTFEVFTAPEAALRQRDALLGLLARAQAGDTVYVQQLYEYATWGSEALAGPNLRLEAYINAARRGARVRILLNSGGFDQEYYDPTQNRATADVVNQIARAENLDLRAALGNPTAYGIHNKMVLVHLAGEGGYIHIGSINGSESSSKVNRELALQGQSDAAYAYLETIFLHDWHRSTPIFLPGILNQYTPPQHLLISEVYYATSDVNREWVEIYNPTGFPIDLSAHKIGDAATPTDYEGMYVFPPGTIIQPQQVLVIAVSGARTPEADLEMVDDSTRPDMLRYIGWGEGGWNLANGGDQVILLGPNEQPVDVVLWGTAVYPGVNPHPGVSLSSSSLERYPTAADTEDCTVDFRERGVPAPGTLPQSKDSGTLTPLRSLSSKLLLKHPWD
ncbi:MAG: lamin tail domain-containing protein [Anaerolineae bacterium]|nr:lamin tail domain-containing protein [Anaerolineae bacterium]